MAVGGVGTSPAMSKRQRGRPKKPEGSVRNLQVRICVSPAEHKRIKRAAKAAGLSMSALTRDLVLRGIGYRKDG